MKKLAVLFPGAGYTNDRPLIYYASKIAYEEHYEIFKVKYSGFKYGLKGNSHKMAEAAISAYKQAEEELKEIPWGEYEDILFISKSVGTVVAAEYLRRHESLKARSISFTPVEYTFPVRGHGVMFHGNKDSWVEDETVIVRGCNAAGQELVVIPEGDHSLETGDVLNDIRVLHDVMEKVKEFIHLEVPEEIEPIIPEGIVPNLIGLEIDLAMLVCRELEMRGVAMGSGVVTRTEPAAGDRIFKQGQVFLFTE